MSNGIAHNNLNDISKIYLDTISDINKKEQSDDVKRWQQEEAGCETKSESPFRKKKVKAYKESLSNWRTDLREITSDAEATEIDNQPEIKEKKVKNKIKINPEFKEAVKQMGGELLEVKEVDSPDGETDDKLADKKKEQDDAKAKKISDKERKLKMRILRVKMMATKQDAGASIVAGYEPKVNAIKKLVNERLGGKGYKKRKDYAGRTVSGDWEDSDRGAGNKATRRAGGTVKAKSPTYIAHVVNKGKKKVDPKKNPVVEEKKPKNCGCGQDPCVTYGKGDKKKGHNCASKVKHEEYGIGNCIKEMHTLDEDGNVSHYDVMFSNKIIKNVPSSSLEILEGHMHEHYVNEEKNKENFSPHKMIDPSSKKEYMADTYEQHKKYQKMGYVHEAKVDKGRSDYGKASIRNYRSKGPGYGEPAMFDPENKRGKLIDKRREDHKARRGVKGAKVPAYKTEEVVVEDKALAAVKAAILKKHGKGAIYDPKKKQSSADKAKVAAERKKRQDADNKAYASRAKKAGFKSTQDYTDVVARYGSEDNYKKGKGLGT